MSKLPATPWSSFQGNGYDWWYIQDTNGDEIGNVDGSFSYEEATMLAAGPSLLKALKEMIAAWEIACDIYGWDTHHMTQYTRAKKLVEIIEEECNL